MRVWIAAACLVAVSCASAHRPATISRGQDTCAHCRMVIVSQSTAAQIVSPGEEPKFFDEIGCLREFLANLSAPPTADATVYVADHRTGEWVEARRAVFTRTTAATPMATGIVAHVDAASRSADPAARDGTSLTTSDILGAVPGRATP